MLEEKIKQDLLSSHEVAMGYGMFTTAKKFESKKRNVLFSVGFYGKDYVAIRCYPTRGDEGWLTNFLFALSPWKAPYFAQKGTKVRYHSGYFEAWNEVRKDVFAFIESIKGERRSLIVAGGSQGGGVSSLVGIDVAYNVASGTHFMYENVVQTNFFGPKAVNKYGAKSIESRIKRSYTVVYGNDLVTKVVPWYNHVGDILHIGPDYSKWKINIMDHKRAFDKEDIRTLLEAL